MQRLPASSKSGRAPGRNISAHRCTALPTQDPDTPLRRYGKEFGKTYSKRDADDWLHNAPQVRVRQTSDRARDQMGELAALNERLMGNEAWIIRKRVEYLKKKRSAWEGIYDTACRKDAALTLDSLERAMSEAEKALDDGRSEVQSITEARAELLALKAEVQEAQTRLSSTQGRLDETVTKLTELKKEAADMARLNQLSSKQLAEAARLSTHPEAAEALRVEAAAEAAVVSSVTPVLPPSVSSPTPSAKELQKTATPGTGRPLTTPPAKGMESSMSLEPGLKNFWYAVLFTSKLKEDMLIPIELLGEQWVLFRDENGKAACVVDECAHRACPLSLGTVENGQVSCPYHGWTFNSSGECTKMPSTVQCRGVEVAHLPTVERDGFIWVWPGDAEPVEVPDNTLPPSGFTLHSEIEVEVPVEHGLLMENLLDLAHAPFTHTSTFAKGWPVPDVVKFHTQRMLGGNWDPYPIDMSFEPPCMVVSMIGLKQPGQIEAGARASECSNHLHQLHVCLPSREGHTRLLYRMSLDFMGWLKYVPKIQMFWEYIAGQVLGEDLVLVLGQQDRMQRGGNTWQRPVTYDKLAVRYRRWRNKVGHAEVVPAAAYDRQTMDAGALFSLEEDAGSESDGDTYCDVKWR